MIDDIERIAHVCHEASRALQVTSFNHDGYVAPHFTEAPEWMVDSSIEGVEQVLEGSTPEQLHASWCEYKTATGWTFGDTKDATKKTHPYLVPYDDLPEERRLKDRVFLAIVNAFQVTP